MRHINLFTFCKTFWQEVAKMELYSPCINYMQYPWGYAVPVRICITREDMHYPWVISSVPVRICSTRESYHQYLWVISLIPLEDMQYPWGYALLVREVSFIFHSYKFTHGYCISSQVLRIWLTGTDDMTHGYCISSRVLRIWLTGTEDMTHGYCISSRVLRIWLTGTAYPHSRHRYWGYDWRVLTIWLTGNAYPHGYWRYDSRVLMIWLTGNAYPHGYCMPSQVLHIVYTGWYWI